MEDLLRTIISQNERIISLLARMAEKLDLLDEIGQDINSIDTAVAIIEGVPEDLAIDIKEIKSELAGVHEELQWHKDLSSASQIIRSIDTVVAAIEQERL